MFKPIDTTSAFIRFNKFSDISEFVSLVTKCYGDVTIESGRYTVNAKSIMALYSLDLTKPLKVKFYGEIPREVEKGIKKFTPKIQKQKIKSILN